MKQRYDAVIIGGGIQGVGCAQSLAANGHSVLLLEKLTVGSGTSSRSSKLIHGGLRYLETAQFSLVRKSLHERLLLSRLAPHLVKQHPFYIPVYRNWRLKPWKLTIGLFLYSLLGNFSTASRFSRLPKAHWQHLDGIKQHNLIAVFRYYDAQTNDLALTQAVGQSAKTLGAEIKEHHQFIGTSKNADDSLTIKYKSSDHQGCDENTLINTVQASVLINAAGPWVDTVQQAIDWDMDTPKMSLVKGSHIEFDTQISDKFYYVESPDDQRAVFIMPWQGRTLVGTTEQAHPNSPETQKPSENEMQYLLRTVAHYFPDFSGNITSAWSGLRVLPRPVNTAAGIRVFSKQARDTMIVTNDNHRPRVISLFGGKLTAYRITANKVRSLAEKTLPSKGIQVDTSTIPL